MRLLRYNCFASGVLAFSTERGKIGNALSPYDGFNINLYCGDTAEHVAVYRTELCATLGISNNCLILPHQTHDTVVANVDNGDSLEGVDAVMTSQQGVCIGVCTADCIPVLLHDTRHNAICAIHSGWRGTVKHISAKALEAMAKTYGTRREDVVAAIGPGIRQNAFEVGDEVYEAFAEAGFHDTIKQAERVCGRWHIDLVTAVQEDLTGLQHIHDCGLCTHTQYDRFFSARRLGVNSGRIYSAIMLTDFCPDAQKSRRERV